ncbi:MAG: hypothetical protein ACM3MI_01315, partial [Clostridiales bacterium]
MLIKTPATFCGKEAFDLFLQSLPSDKEIVDIQRKVDLSISAFEIYTKSLPYKLRPICLYYFYHYFPLNINDGNTDSKLDSQQLQEKLELLNDYAEESLKNEEIKKYLGLLGSSDYFEVLQIRGEIEALCSGLNDYLDLAPDIEWSEIQDSVLDFLEKEPICSASLLEKFFSGLSKYYSDNNLKTSIRYKVAQKIWDCSTNLDMLNGAWLCLNNPGDIFEFKKSTLAESEVKKLLRLENIEKEIMDSFDDNRLSRSQPKKGRIRQLFLDDFCLSWIKRIEDSLTLFNNDNYVKGYAEFLKGYICYASGHFSRALRELHNAYLHQYNPVIVLIYMVNILEAANKCSDAVEYAQQTIKMLSADKEDLKKEECLQKVTRVLKRTNTEPVHSNSIILERAKENESTRADLMTILDRATEENKIKDKNERTMCGIRLFDQLIDPFEINQMFVSPYLLDERFVIVPVTLIELAGLDELDLFDLNIENNDCSVMQEITLNLLLSFNAQLICKRFVMLEDKTNGLIREFPNSLACIFIIEKVIQYLLRTVELKPILELAVYLSSQLKGNPVPGLYKVLEPLRLRLDNAGMYEDEINFIAAISGCLSNEELKIANAELNETLSKSKSAGKILARNGYVKRKSFLGDQDRKNQAKKSQERKYSFRKNFRDAENFKKNKNTSDKTNNSLFYNGLLVANNQVI